MAITHVVMWADAAQREASRAHLAALLRDHHLPLPGEHNTHLRVDLGAFRLRWELHTSSSAGRSWRPWRPTASPNASPRARRERAREWLAQLPGQCLCSLHLWVLPTQGFGNASLVPQVLREDTLVASTVADGHGEVTPTLPSMPTAAHAWCCSRAA